MPVETTNEGLPTPQLDDAPLVVYVIVATLGAIIWDIITNLNADYHLLRDFAMSWTVVIYGLSRVATLVAFALSTAAGTKPTSNCFPILNAMSWTFAIAISSTTLLFFFRIRAVCMENKCFVGFFFLLWLGVVGACIAGATGRHSASNYLYDLGQSHYCLSDPVNLVTLITSMSTVPMANDILGFVAVTRQLMRNASIEMNFKHGWRIAIFGQYLPALSRALLKDSQAYFLTTVTIAVFSTVTFYSPGVLQNYSIALVLANVAIMNLMGGKIYRNTRLGIRIRSSTDAQTVSLPSRVMVFQAGNVENTAGEV